MFKYPGVVVAMDIWLDANTIQQARKKYKEYYGIKRLQNGFEIWKA